MPNRNLIIENGAIIGYTGNVNHLTIPTGIKEIKTNGICANADLKELYLPDTLEKLCTSSIRGCYNLKEIYFPENMNLQVIEDYPIKGCINLETIIFKNKSLKVPDTFLKPRQFCELCTSFFPEQLSFNTITLLIPDILEYLMIGDHRVWQNTWLHYFLANKKDLLPYLIDKLPDCMHILGSPLLDENDLFFLFRLAKEKNNDKLADAIKKLIDKKCTKEEDINCLFDEIIEEYQEFKKLHYDAETEKEEYKELKEFEENNAIYINPTYKEKVGSVTWSYNFSDVLQCAIITGYKGSLKKLTIPETLHELPVKIIGRDVFSLDPSIKSQSEIDNLNKIEIIIFPDTVKMIPEKCFKGYTNLKNVKLPEGLAFIQKSTFSDCINLESINMPEKLTELNSFAFKNCKSLKSITIPGHVSLIGTKAFEKCASLNSVTFTPQKRICLTIDDGAFFHCSSLESIKLPEGVKAILPKTFLGCINLKEISFPSSLVKLSYDALKDCSNIENVTIESHDLKLTEKDFEPEVLGRLTRTLYPVNLSTSLKKLLLAEIASILNSDEYVNEEWKQAWLTYLNTKKRSRYEETLTNKNLFDVLIKEKLFTLEEASELVEMATARGEAEMSSLLLQYINNNFSSEERMEKINRELNVDVTSEEYLKLIWNFRKIDKSTIRITNYKGTLTVVEVPKKIGPYKVVALGKMVFTPKNQNLSEAEKEIKRSITSISIPNCVKEIGQNCFAYCSSLTDLRLPEGITELYSSTEIVSGPFRYGFLRGTKVEKLELPKSIERINYCAFAGNTSLKEITLPNKLKFIATNAFAGATSLEEITVPKNVTNLSYYAFRGCTSLKKITLLCSAMEDLPSHLFTECSSLEEIILPEGLKTLSEGLFYECKSLKVVTIPKSVESFKFEMIKIINPYILYRVKRGSPAAKFMKQEHLNYEFY